MTACRGEEDRRAAVAGAAALLLEGRGLPPVAGVPPGAGPSAAVRRALDLAAPTLRDPRTPPLVLGAILERSLAPGRRRDQGAHFTDDSLVEAILGPTLVRPWERRIRETPPEGRAALAGALRRVRVLDPACGGGAFLVHAWRALVHLERALAEAGAADRPGVSLSQLSGIDVDPLAIEVARVTLGVEAADARGGGEPGLTCADALHAAWPAAEVIVGNPPFLAKNRMQAVLGRDGLNRLRARYPDVPGHADYCVYFFRRAHDGLPPGGRAGLIGTDGIRRTHSRAGGLDHVVATGGTLVEAAPGLRWEGGAGVRVAWVSWVKGPTDEPRVLHLPDLDGRSRPVVVSAIGPSLSRSVDLGGARPLPPNLSPRRCFQGVTAGHPGFVLSPSQADALLARDPASRPFLVPLLRPEELVGPRGGPDRFLVDLHPEPLERVEGLAALDHLRSRVLPARAEKAAEEARRNERARAATAGAPVNRHHAGFLRRWWWPSYPRPELKEALRPLSRYLVCPRYGDDLLLVFVPVRVRPSDDLHAFAFDDDHSFAVLQSAAHRAWFRGRCSSLLHVPRYTSTTVYDAFPWPAPPSARVAAEAADQGRVYRELRDGLAARHGGYRALARRRDPQRAAARAGLDAAVAALYGLGPDEDPLPRLLQLNLDGGGARPGPWRPGTAPEP